MMQRIRSRAVKHLKWQFRRLDLMVSLVLACSLMESAIAVSETPRSAVHARARGHWLLTRLGIRHGHSQNTR